MTDRIWLFVIDFMLTLSAWLIIDVITDTRALTGEGFMIFVAVVLFRIANLATLGWLRDVF